MAKKLASLWLLFADNVVKMATFLGHFRMGNLTKKKRKTELN